MSSKLLLRIAAVLMLLHTVGHTMGALTWKEAPTPQLAKVISGMLESHFAFMGRQVSYGSFFEGYGISMIFVMLLVTVLLWQLSANQQRPQIAALAIFLLLFGVSELVYFFPFAAAFSLLAGIFTSITLFKKT